LPPVAVAVAVAVGDADDATDVVGGGLAFGRAGMGAAKADTMVARVKSARVKAFMVYSGQRMDWNGLKNWGAADGEKEDNRNSVYKWRRIIRNVWP